MCNNYLSDHHYNVGIMLNMVSEARLLTSSLMSEVVAVSNFIYVLIFDDAHGIEQGPFVPQSAVRSNTIRLLTLIVS